MHLAGRASWLAVVLSLVVAGTAGAADTGRLVADEAGWADTSRRTRNEQYCNELTDQPNPPPTPTVAQQYTAKIEMVQLVTNSSGHEYKLLDYAEYGYDAAANLVSIQMYSKYFLLRYLLNWNTKQMVEVHVSKTGVQDKKCVVRGLEEALILFPAIWGAGKNLSTEHIVEPGALMGLPEGAEIHYKGRFDCRGILCSRWDWCGLKQFEQDAGTQLVTMATFWNVPGWQVPVQQYQTLPPLGWQVEVQHKQDDGSTLLIKEKVHNTMYYRPEIVDPSAFLISQDVYCSGLTSAPGHPFPNFTNDRLFTFSMEVRETKANTITWADGWYDFEKQLYRIDHDVMLKGRDAVPTTEIFDFSDRVAFTFPQESLLKCKVTIINNTHTDWSDITGISHLWADNPNAFFGTDVVNYTYYGPGVVRYVEGQEWRAVRTDWPPDASDGDTHTLWQWTFASKNVSVVADLGEHLYLERQVPIGLRVTALHDLETSLGHIPQGSAYVYQLYDFNVESDGRYDIYSDGGDFDTYGCYSANWREHLKFRLDVSSWPEVVDTPLMTSSWFNEQWQTQLARYGQLSTLRITRVKTVVEDAGDVWVEFVLLYRHPMIGQLDPDVYEHMTTGSQAKTFISVAINNGNIKFVGMTPDDMEFVLLAESGSLSQVVAPVCSTIKPTTNPTVPPDHTTAPPLQHSTTTTTKRPPDHTSTTTTKPPLHHTTTTKPPLHHTTTTTTNSQYTGSSDTSSTKVPNPPGDKIYTSGDLAGLGVGLLITGLATGAAGTFLVVVKRLHHTLLACCGKA